MTIISPLPIDLFEVGKCYSMIRNKSEIRFKVHSYDLRAKSFALQMNYSRMNILQLTSEEISSIREITEEQLGKVVRITENGGTLAAE